MTDSETVYITPGMHSNNVWHVDPENCPNANDSDTKQKAKRLIEPTYRPCSICAGGDKGHNTKRALYECSGCGKRAKKSSTGVRTKTACHECNEIIRWERVDR